MDKIKIFLSEDEIGLLLAGLAVYETWLYRYDSKKDEYYQNLLSDMDRVRNTLRYMVISAIKCEE